MYFEGIESMSDTKLKVAFFKDGSSEFFKLLDQAEINYNFYNPFPEGTVVASGEIIEILQVIGGVSIVPSITAIIVQWLKLQASREVIVTTHDNNIIHLKGFSEEKMIAVALEYAKDVVIIQTTPDDKNA